MENKVSGSSITFTGLLTLAFIVLKLLGKIDWKWRWVLAPIWINILIALVMFLIFIIITLTEK